MYTCFGYEEDSSVSCTDNKSIMAENPLSKSDPDNWCHTCPSAPVKYDVSLTAFYIILFVILLLGIPFLFFLNEEKKVKENVKERIGKLWQALNNRSHWQMILFTLVFQTLTTVGNPAYGYIGPALLGFDNLILYISGIIQVVVFLLLLVLFNKFGLGYSRRKVMIAYIMVEIIFTHLFDLLMIYDVTHSMWFYLFQQAPDIALEYFPFLMIYTSINNIAESGLETTVHALFTSCTAIAAVFGSTAIKQVFLHMFPAIASGADVAKDTSEMRNEYTKFNFIAIILKVCAIYCLPMLPAHEAQIDALHKKNERSTMWATIATLSFFGILIFSVATTLLELNPTYSCYKVLGGQGCTTNENEAWSYVVITIALAWCIFIPTFMIYWPIVMKKETFSWGMFV